MKGPILLPNILPSADCRRRLPDGGTAARTRAGTPFPDPRHALAQRARLNGDRVEVNLWEIGLNVPFLFFTCYTDPVYRARTGRPRADIWESRAGFSASDGWRLRQCGEPREGHPGHRPAPRPFGCMGLFFMFSVSPPGNAIDGVSPNAAEGRIQRLSEGGRRLKCRGRSLRGFTACVAVSHGM